MSGPDEVIAAMTDGQHDERPGTLPADVAGMVRLFCGHDAKDTDHGTFVYTGFAGYPIVDEGYELMAKLPSRWRVVSKWGDWPYSIAWCQPEERALMHYVEGDLRIEVARDVDGFKAMVARWDEALNLGLG